MLAYGFLDKYFDSVDDIIFRISKYYTKYMLSLYRWLIPKWYTIYKSSTNLNICQKRSSTVCMVMNKLPSHPPIFILTPGRRSTLICIYHPDPTPSSYIINYMTYYCFRMPVFLSISQLFTLSICLIYTLFYI
jgi:hypothetical protein